jgi:hypothetical protein
MESVLAATRERRRRSGAATFRPFRKPVLYPFSRTADQNPEADRLARYKVQSWEIPLVEVVSKRT